MKTFNRLFRQSKRLAGDREGATAIEFGILVLPFVALLAATVETGLIYFANQTMETAVGVTARLLRTGEAQGAHLDKNAFKTQICNFAGAIFDCTKIHIDVRTVSGFGSIDLTVPKDANGNLNPEGFTFDGGHGGDIVVARAFYEWPTYASMLGFNLANTGNGTYLIAGTSAFRNEPFPW
ncbi:MAG: TadE/TadG family type IV pilus assembly protein [Bauldia sp.]